ncbi:MAG: hypothetical protein JXO49_04320 [Deltaproteobacteria bacterium]|nr:hypothetical protein [Candidatus Anaeroferrophillus wilburensis]MBN2888554.1 hypothetical protein [Deltaproteobacteria bacterium]
MEEKKAELIVAAYAMMRVDAIGIGEKEYNFGAPFLRRLAAGSPVNLLCANLVDREQQQNYFLPYLLLRKGGKRVLITAVIDPQYGDYLHREPLTITDPVAALTNIQRSVNHDLFIVMAHAERPSLTAWLDRVAGIDLVIQGHQPGLSRQREIYRQTMIVNNNVRGSQYVSHIDCQPQPKGWTLSAPHCRRLDTKNTGEDQQIKTMVAEYDTWRHRHLQQQSQQRTSTRPMQQENGEQQTFKPGTAYLGIQACVPCHQQQFQHWRQTRHARAIITLIRRQKELDPACLPCHVTGMNHTNVAAGFRTLRETPRLTNVQCEACHGPAAGHPQEPKASILRPVAKQTCLNCHTTDTDPDFDYHRDLDSGTHRSRQLKPEDREQELEDKR